MKKIFLLSALILSYIGVCAQGIQVGDVVDMGGGLKVRYLGNAKDLGISFRPAAKPEDLGQVKGVIKDAKGNPIKDAQVVISGEFFNRSTKSKKDGSYTIGSMEGFYTIEISHPGYKKFSAMLVIKPQQTQKFDLALEPDVEGVEQMKGKGNVLVCADAGYSMKVASSHPAYEGKSLMDVLEDAPMITFTKDKMCVADADAQVFFNNVESKAPFAAMKRFCESISAKNVVEIKVRRTNMANANVPNLIYITYKE